MPASETLVLSTKVGRFLPLWAQATFLAVRSQLLVWDTLGPPTWVLVHDRSGALRGRVSLGRDTNGVSGVYDLMVRDLDLLDEQEFLEKWAD